MMVAIAQGPSRRGLFGREVGREVICEGRGRIVDNDIETAVGCALEDCVASIARDLECSRFEGRYVL